MRNTIILATFVGLIAVGCINAQFPRRKSGSDIYKWNVEIDSDTFVSQKAVALQSRNAIFLFTYGKGMKEMNMTGSSMLMEYTDPAGVMVVRFGSRRKGICFLMPISETLDQIKSDLETKDGTNITLANTVAYNGTASPLTREEANSVFQQHPTIRPFCFRAPLVETTSMTLGESDPDTKTVTMLAWDSRVSLMVRGGGGGPGAGGGRGDADQGDDGPKDKPRRKWPRRGPLFPRRRG